LLDLLLHILLLAVSLVILIKGCDWFIDSSEKIGLSLGVSPFIIGVSIVAFGTSLPELASCIAAATRGEPEIVSGTVIGSNITNILLVLGAVATFSKTVKMEYEIMDVDMPLLVTSAFLLWFVFKWDGIEIIEAIIFLICLVIFLINSFVSGKKDQDEKHRLRWKEILLLVLGGIMVTFGAEYTVVSITEVSKTAGISSDIIAQTWVALGTSLPEVAVSITASRRGKVGIAVGNVLGSNIFNTFGIVSIASFFGPLSISEEMLSFTLPFMIAVTIIFALISIAKRIVRWEGMMLLLLYVFFIYQSYFGVLG
jgi:cation:H+ antiporter